MNYNYSQLTAYVDPTGEENPVKYVDASVPQMDESQVGIEAWKHNTQLATQFDINQVADQLSNDPQRPKMKVTKEQLQKGGPIDYATANPLVDERDSGSSPTPTPTPDPSTDPSVDLNTLTSSDPNHWAYDGNKDGIPDSNQWTVL